MAITASGIQKYNQSKAMTDLFQRGEKGEPLIFLAPMAGLTDKFFRAYCKDLGADVVLSEFVSAEGVLRDDERTGRYLEFDETQRPFGIQLFGANPDNMAAAAKKVWQCMRPDFVDLNFGCPARKVVCKNGGSALLREPELLIRVTEAVIGALNGEIPVSAKLRLGWDESSVNAVELCKRLEGVGVEWLCVHGRTRAQAYRGNADWERIAECAAALQIPLIGNGDIEDFAGAYAKWKSSSCAALMVGRAAAKNPWIFRELRSGFARAAAGEAVADISLSSPTLRERWDLIVAQCEHAVANFKPKTNRMLGSRKRKKELATEELAIIRQRGRLLNYTKAMPEAKNLRAKLGQIRTLAELRTCRDEHLREFAGVCGNPS